MNIQGLSASTCQSFVIRYRKDAGRKILNKCISRKRVVLTLSLSATFFHPPSVVVVSLAPLAQSWIDRQLAEVVQSLAWWKGEHAHVGIAAYSRQAYVETGTRQCSLASWAFLQQQDDLA